MNESEFQALINLLDDPTPEVYKAVEQKILSYGEEIIPLLEKEWEENIDPIVQGRIENIIHDVQKNKLAIRFERWCKEESQDLLKGVYLIATYQYPDLTFEKIKEQFEQIYYDCWLATEVNQHPKDQVKAINHILFNKHHFSPNTRNFHSPANSMINAVLESRKGNPLSLCVIYMLVTQRLGLPVYGVNLPNLFVLIYTESNSDHEFYINVFNRGLIFSKEDITKYIEQLGIQPKEHYFNPCLNLDIIARMIRNLLISFEKLGETEKIDELNQLLNLVLQYITHPE